MFVFSATLFDFLLFLPDSPTVPSSSALCPSSQSCTFRSAYATPAAQGGVTTAITITNSVGVAINGCTFVGLAPTQVPHCARMMML